jgi:DNA-binding transcriptional regulator/RsmH inhibitor MraZ
MSHYLGTLDQKGRVVVPAEYRKLFTGASNLKIRKALNRACLILSTINDWNNELKAILSNEYSAQYETKYKNNSFEVAIDDRGRIILKQQLRSLIEIREQNVKGIKIEFRDSKIGIELWKK